MRNFPIIKNDTDGKLYYEENGRIIWVTEVCHEIQDLVTLAFNQIIDRVETKMLEKNLKDSQMKIKKRKSLVNCNWFSPTEIILEVKKCSSCGGNHVIPEGDYHKVIDSDNEVFICPQNKECVEYTTKE